MEIEDKRVGKWLVQVAQVSTSTRRNSMSSVLDTYLRSQSARIGIADYKEFLKKIRDDSSLYETITEDERDFFDKAGGLGAWIMVASCAKPYISIDEWLSLDDKTVNDISSAVMEVNPQWFSATPEQEKKTKRKRRKSIPASQT